MPKQWRLLYAVYPDKCTLSLVGIDDQEMHQRRLGRWNDVYGFRMTCLKTKVYCEADVEVVSSSKLLTNPCCIKVSQVLVYSSYVSIVTG